MKTDEEKGFGNHFTKNHADSDVEPTTENQIQTLYEEIVGVRGIEADDEFSEFDGGVERAIALVGRINERFGSSFGLSVLAEARIPAALALLVDKAGAHDTGLVCIRPSGDAPSLFCFAATEESVLRYSTFRRLLDSDRPIYALPPAQSLDSMNWPTLQAQIAHYMEVIQTVQVRGPYYLLGEGNGGILAYEVAQQLVKSRMRVAMLGLIDTPGPDSVRVEPSWTVRLRSRVQTINTRITQRRFHRPSRECETVRVNGSLFKMRSFTARRTKSAGEDMFRLRMLRTEMSVRRLIENHVLAPYPGRVILFRSSKLSPFLESDFTLGWRSLFPHGRFVVKVIPSYYGSMLEQPFVRLLAPELQAALRISDMTAAP